MKAALCVWVPGLRGAPWDNGAVLWDLLETGPAQCPSDALFCLTCGHQETSPESHHAAKTFSLQILQTLFPV